MRLRLVPALLLLLALVGGCGEDAGTAGSTPTPNATETGQASETPEAPETASEGPVAGSGAALSPAEADAWCAAITADQLTALTGFEVVEVVARGDGVGTCRADLPGVDLELAWGSATTQKSQEQYAASWTRPAGVFDVTDLTLAGGRAAVVATAPSPRSATAGSVFDGRVLQAQVSAVGADESTTVEDIAGIAEAIVAVYVA